ncbi:MAG: hypothetical protein IH968_19245 [Gemmatimonadetes bacterium]|nr:hypothetical protein [Gemmatimonadota bacterium]
METMTRRSRKRSHMRPWIRLWLAAIPIVTGCDILSPGDSTEPITLLSPDCPLLSYCAAWRWSPNGDEIVYRWWLPSEGSRRRPEYRAIDVSNRRVRTLVESFDDQRRMLAYIGMQVLGPYLYFSATDETGSHDNGCCSGPGRGSDIYRVRVDGGTLERVARNIGMRYTVSPDGSTLTTVRFTNDQHLSRYDIPSRTWSEFPMEVPLGWINWAPDGSSFVLVDPFAGFGNIGTGGQLYDLRSNTVRAWSGPEGIVGHGGSEVSRTIFWDRGEPYLVAVRGTGTIVRRRLRDDTDVVVHTFAAGLEARVNPGLSVSGDGRFAAMWRNRCPNDGSVCGRRGSGHLEAVVVNLRSGGEVVVKVPSEAYRILDRTLINRPPVLSPDGCRVAFSAGGLWIKPVPGAC